MDSNERRNTMPLNHVRFLNREAPIFGKILFGRILKQIINLVNEVRGDSTTNNTLTTDTKRLVNEIRASLLGDYLDSGAGLAIGTTKPNVSNIEFDYHLAGVEYNKPINAAGTALSGDDVPQSLYGGWALDIGANKTIDITPAAANATGYASAVLAIAGIPAVAADHIRLGTVTAIKVDVDFLNSAPSLAIGTTKTNISHVEFTHWHSQVEKTEPALPAGKILAGDSIPQSKYGAFRLEIGVDETLDLIPADDNSTGYDSSVLALAGLPTIQANHVNVGTLTVIKVDDNFLNSAPSLAIGSTKPNVAHAEFTHWHSQVEKTEGALAAGMALAGDTVPQNLYGAFRFQIGVDETLDLVPAADNVSGYASAALALAGLPAIEAGHVNVGTVSVFHNDAGGFIPGTTDLDAAGTAVIYTDGALDGFFIPGTTELDDAEVTDVYADGALDGFFDPGTTELDDAEVTDDYVDATPGRPTIGAAVTASSPAALTATDVDDINGEVDD